MNAPLLHMAGHLQGVSHLSGGNELLASDLLDVAVNANTLTVTPKSFKPHAGETRAFEWGVLHEGLSFFHDVRSMQNPQDNAGLYRDRAAWWGVQNLSRYRYRLDVRGYENLDPEQRYIFAPTHTSELDFSLLSYLLRPFDLGFFMKFELGGSFYIGPALRAVPWNIFVDRLDPEQAMTALHSAVARAKDPNLHESWVIFPHGVFPGPPLESPDDDGDLFSPGGKFQGQLMPGVASMAIHSGLPVVPITVNGASRVFRYGGRLERYTTLSAKKNATIEVIIDKPIEMASLTGSATKKMRQILTGIEDSYREHYRAPLSPRRDLTHSRSFR